jgi:DNA-binding NarL/FixJ family response regulator
MKSLALSSSAEQLVATVRLAAQEGSALSSVQESGGQSSVGESDLSEREFQVAELLSQDCLLAEIAQALQISESTVKTHAVNVRRKLGVASTRELRGRKIPAPRKHKKV